MATISIYAGKTGLMPDMIKGAKNAVKNLKEEFSTLKNKAMSVSASICDLNDVINSISATVKTQEDKAEALESFREKSEEFIDDAVRIDDDVADKVNQNKDDFYDKYTHLKPECEKTFWEKVKETAKKTWEWCKENWIAIVTAVVVVVVAIVAAVCGVAIAAIAAIAGLIGLVLCIADVICMIATGGKSIADLCNENGLGWLGQIFSGLSIGCAIVEIVFPLGAAVKSMMKVGVKSFCKGAIAGLKASFKEALEAVWTKGFKVGFKDGLKNTGKLLIKTFIFDIDDVSRMDNGKRVWNLMEDTLPLRTPNTGADGYWEFSDGKYYPRDDVIPKDKRYNPDGLSMKELFDQSVGKLGIDIDHIPTDKFGNPDFSAISAFDSQISMKNFNVDYESFLNGDLDGEAMGDILRKINFSNADAKLPDGVTYGSLQKNLDIKLTRHEMFTMDGVNYVPTAIHANLAHNGGISRYKFIIQQIPNQSEVIIKNLTRALFPVTHFALNFG